MKADSRGALCVVVGAVLSVFAMDFLWSMGNRGIVVLDINQVHEGWVETAMLWGLSIAMLAMGWRDVFWPPDAPSRRP